MSQSNGDGRLHQHTDVLAAAIAAAAQELRIDVLRMVYAAQGGHLGGSFSAAEIVAALYLHQLRVDPGRPDWPERDRFLLSKGHAAPLLYAVLARCGFISRDELTTFRHFPTRLEGHPDRRVPGVEMVAGPLGHGVAVGSGLAWALSREGSKPSGATAPSARASRSRVYVLLGDGELDAGVVWEGALVAAKYRLGNLTAIVDANGIQQTGATADVLPLESLEDKWSAFGWHVQEIHGHNVREILDALDRADEVHARPSVIIARTTKGRGVSFMEYDHRWHGGIPSRDEFEQALAELEEGLAR